MWNDEEDESDTTTLTKVLCHNEGFLVTSGNGGFINSYQITNEFEVRIVESYLVQN